MLFEATALQIENPGVAARVNLFLEQSWPEKGTATDFFIKRTVEIRTLKLVLENLWDPIGFDVLSYG